MSDLDNETLPSSETEQEIKDLWSGFHDTHLIRIKADPLARTVEMILDPWHLREFAQLDSNVTWRFMLDAVTEVSVCRWEIWPGPPPVREGLSRDEQNASIADYQAKGRMTSMAWPDFEAIVQACGFQISEATLRVRNSGTVFECCGHDEEDEAFFTFKLVGTGMHGERSDGQPGSLEDMLRLGEAYWDAFAARRKS